MYAVHFGWTPQQVASMTPRQLHMFLPYIERMNGGDNIDGRTGRTLRRVSGPEAQLILMQAMGAQNGK